MATSCHPAKRLTASTAAEVDGETVHSSTAIERYRRPARVLARSAAGDTRWVFLDGEVYEFEVDAAGRKRSGAARITGSLTAPMPATVHRDQRRAPATVVKRGDIAARPRSDEDGAAGPGHRRRHGHSRPLPRRRARASRRVTLIELESMSLPRTRHASSKSARATGCRTSPRAIATADKIAFVDRLSDGRLAGDRGRRRS